jgi:tetratricopeptide (TPR) repeat protein
MILPVTDRQSHSTRSILRLKPTIPLLLAVAATLAGGWQSRPTDPLRRELTGLLESGQTGGALARAQAALRQAPDDPVVRGEYVSLHLALARYWLAQRRFDDCLTVVSAILAVEPDHSEALDIQRELLAARQAASQQLPEIDRLLRLELFDSVLERIREVEALRPDLTGKLASRKQAAWRGAADDHYFAGNFNEAFALYEHLRSLSKDEQPDVASRWLVTLALALSQPSSNTLRPDGCEKLAGRVSRDGSAADHPRVAHAILGLLAEQAGQQRAAGQRYAAALEIPWDMPSADERGVALARLRAQAVQYLDALHDSDRTRWRGGAWQIKLADVWKHRRTEHFEVYARNDLVAERVAEAAEYHFAGLCDWLAVAVADPWEPRCELRVHATRDEWRRVLETGAVTGTPTEMRIQGERMLLRCVNLCQDDPWLLSATLPHELTHVILADACQGGNLPPAIDEGLALQSEPPARRLRLCRLLGASVPDLAGLLTATQSPANESAYCAGCDALTGLLLYQAAASGRHVSGRSPVSLVLEAFRNGCASEWWRTVGWDSEATLLEDWRAWHDARRTAPRVPLMMLTQSSEQTSLGQP